MLNIGKPINKDKLTEENILEFYKTVCNLTIMENESINVYQDTFDDMIQIIVYRDLSSKIKHQFTIYIYLNQNYFSIECFIGNIISGVTHLDFTPVLISDYQCKVFF